MISYRKFVGRVVILTTVVIGLLFFLYGYFIQSHSIKQNLKNETSLMIDLIFENLYTAMQNGATKDDLNKIISNIENKISHSKINLYKTIDEAKEDNIKQVFISKEADFYTHGSHIDFARPIIFEEKCIKCHINDKAGAVAAVIRLEFSILDLNVSLKDILVMIAILFFISMTVILIVWYSYLHNSFILPVKKLIDQMLEISKHEDLKKDIKINSDIQEIKVLEDVFNTQHRKLVNAFSKLEHISNIDPLTKVSNRKKFDEYIKTEFDSVKRYGYDFCLILIDLNKFKFINDTYGHHMGDKVLTEFSDIVSRNIRSTDNFFRLGGDEFIITLAHTNSNNALKIINNLKDKINKHKINENGIEINISASFGLAQYEIDAIDLKELIKIADERMYKDKKGN